MSTSLFTVGSSRCCSSPTSALLINSRIPCVGLLWCHYKDRWLFCSWNFLILFRVCGCVSTDELINCIAYLGSDVLTKIYSKAGV